MLFSCTNYECFKGIFSSFNDNNMFEIAYSLNRQFGPENWTLYKGMQLLNFVDNHDVSRLASNLKQEQHIMPAYGLLFTMPGIPSIYYGSEWGAKGEKQNGQDAALRPAFLEPVQNEISDFIAKLSQIRKENKALQEGGYKQIYLTNKQFAFERICAENRLVIAINTDAAPHTANIQMQGNVTELLNGKTFSCNGSAELLPYSAAIFKAN
jgi:glycosidase